MKDGPNPHGAAADGQSPRRKLVPRLRAEELIDRLWTLYRHLAHLRCAHVTDLERLCRVPSETLSDWWTHPNQTLCGVNEEKLARGLGGSGSAFRRLIERTAGRNDWLKYYPDLWQKNLPLLLGWLPVEALENELMVTVLA